MDRQIGMLLQGVIFTGLTLCVLYILKEKDPELFKNIGLKSVKFSSKMIVGIALPFILLVSGILTAYLFGGIENVRFNLTPSIIIAILINTVTAFMYEAFPEEVFIRGMIFEELHKKFRFIISLILQPLIFICVPIAVMVLNSIIFNEPFAVTIDYFILLLTFGVALQLYRKYTGSLWISI
ncbi:CPBP family glutamic-type intramembrane protease, partial [Sporosarcina cascadiensis]|uniref:CPBP family glutamic-type intramembrane protease n=1 Tax=Sporosarcina cascadiensis TaxID=2660747 RepID=UPI001890DEDA